MKAKTNLENRYMKRNTELQISQTQKKCNRTEELLLEEIEVITATLRMNTVGGIWAVTPHTASPNRGGRAPLLIFALSFLQLSHLRLKVKTE